MKAGLIDFIGKSQNGTTPFFTQPHHQSSTDGGVKTTSQATAPEDRDPKTGLRSQWRRW